ncbi:MAG: PfkB family carbohydrate kinase [Halothiobacillus sp.]
MAIILGIGIATLDIINEVDHYPSEDSEQRALAQRQRTGGNVTNTLTVLRQFNHHCALAAVLTQDTNGLLIQEKLSQRGLDLSSSHRIGFGHAPTSYITLNRSNGSRTILHYRDLPELDLNAFLKIDLTPFDWLHFEGRHCMDTAAMLALARSMSGTRTLSLEIEKERPFLAQLFTFPDVIFFSRAFAEGRNFTDPEAFLTQAHRWAPQAVLVLGWGDAGAHWLEPQNAIVQTLPSQPIAHVVDSIGAGDTLIAGIIHARLHQTDPHTDWSHAVEFGVRLAERKIQQIGFDGLAQTEDTAAKPLCHLDDLGPADALGVLPVNGVPSMILVRTGKTLRAFRNICPHNGSPLAKTQRGYLVNKLDDIELRCAVHNAHFELAAGACTQGPCPGTHLQAVPIRVTGEHVFLDATPEKQERVKAENPGA